MNNFKEAANEAYYNEDEPILSDKEFDLISDHGLETVNFRNKVNHAQPMGSLKKIKTKEDFNKWFQSSEKCKISPKLDGNSVEMIFKDGILVQAITRGDGFVGNDVTDKVKMCNYRPMDTGSYKAEAIMKKEYQKDYDKNIRNVVAGALGRKTPKDEDLVKIDIIFFSDVGYYFNNLTYELAEETFIDWKENFPYEVDGVVIELSDKIHEEKDDLLPSNTIALKFNKEGVDAVIGAINWQLGKYGRLTPVLKLKTPVEIDGSMVQNVSASNYGIVREAGLGIGAEVQVIKSGDIIPYISKVISTSRYLAFPVCPQCGAEATVSDNGIHAICENCKDDGLVHLKHIFNIFDLEYISDNTIETLYDVGFIDLECIFSLVDNYSVLENVSGFGKRKAANINSKLKNLKVHDWQVLQCAMIQGLGGKQCQKLINHYGGMYKMLASDLKDLEQVDGFGDILAQKIRDNIHKMKEMVNTFHKLDIEILLTNFTKSPKSSKNIVFTGKCEQFGRKELTKKLEENGWTVQSGINKQTNVLLTNNPDPTSSKGKKAYELNIPIKTYDQFFKEEGIS